MQNISAISPDFDFEIGNWHVQHRRLRARLVACDEWDVFNGVSETRLVLGGNGNVEDNLLETPTGLVRAIALRSYNPQQKSWAIWWLSSADPHRLEVPVTGSFHNGIGSFFANEMIEGKPVVTRFLWLETDSATPRWEQAMSIDDGVTWETNWTMDFSRLDPSPNKVI
ncbi:DUF1579 domain-containing protein [Devosia sp. CAU 1758]